MSSQFVPPPSYTTLRFNNHSVSTNEALKTLQRYVDDDLKLRGMSVSSKSISIELHPILNDLLLISVVKLESIARYENEIIVDHSCGVAVLRGAHVFVPGVIAAPPGLKKGDDVSVFVDLTKKCLKGSHSFQGDKCFVGNGTMEVSRHDIFVSSSCSAGVGVVMDEPLYLTPCLDLSTLPRIFFPQNLPSVVVSHVLSPPENSIVLDMCAAPGGKTTHLCSIMRNTGKVIALDRSSNKVKKIMDNAARLGFNDSILAYCADSRNITAEDAVEISSRRNDFSPPYPPHSFSYILLDAPCSALGQRPKFPGISTNSNNISSYPNLQWHLAQSAYRLLASGGTLIYSTCTTTFDENEGMVKRILGEYSDLVLVKQDPHLGGCGRKVACGLGKECLEKLQYFDMSPTKLMSKRHPADSDTIGFFIAKFKKKFNQIR